MRKVILAVAVLVVAVLIVSFYPGHIEKPEINGVGPMAIRLDPAIPAPSTHSPLDYWQTHHMNVVNQGDLAREDCLYCHDPQTSCNNCHTYVGVDQILASKQ